MVLVYSRCNSMISTKWEEAIIWFFYFLVIFCFFCFSSFLIFWIFLEINLILFLLLMVFSLSKGYVYNQILFYFLIQSFGSILLFLYNLHIFFGFESAMGFVSYIFLFLKMGIFPFYKWVVDISFYLSSLVLSMLLSFQKVPLFLVLFYNYENMLIVALILNLVIGSYLIWKCNSNLSLMIYSSIYSTFWFFCLMMWDYKALVGFLIQYSLMVWWFLEINSLYCQANTKLIYIGMFLMGIPPASFFFAKFFVVSSIFSSLSFLLMSIIWLFTFFSFVGYFKFFLKSFCYNINVYMGEIGVNSCLKLFGLNMGVFLFFF